MRDDAPPASSVPANSLSRIETVEPPCNLARQFHVRHLVFADGNEVRLVHQNIRRLHTG